MFAGQVCGWLIELLINRHESETWYFRSDSINKFTTSYSAQFANQVVSEELIPFAC